LRSFPLTKSKLVQNNNLKHFFTVYQQAIAICLSIAMVYGFLAGRAILSLAMFLFFLNAIWNVKASKVREQKWWFLGLAWVGLYALSYFWSEDIPYWQERFQVKYAFVILPIAFGVLPGLTIKHLKWLSWGISVLAIGGCIYSLSFYFKNTDEILKGYFYSKVLTTPAYKDHIRFSVFIALSIIWNCFIFNKISIKWQKIALILTIIFLALYLHILAVRSGLIVLYSFLILYVLALFFRKKVALGSSIIASFLLLLFIAYQNIPSFRLKIEYGLYSLNEYKKGNESAGYSDIGRLISYKMAGKIIQENPIMGVGAGDLRAAMKEKYQKFSPSTKPEQMIVPHNQAMVVCLVGGVFTLIVYLVWLFYPIAHVKRNRNGFYVFATWFALLICLMVEPMLEVQLGVFVYLFALLWIIKAAEIKA